MKKRVKMKYPYSKVWALGNTNTLKLFDDEVLVEEKIDGSQISFYKEDGQIFVRSHHCELYPQSLGMFEKAYATIESISDRMQEGYIYYGEYIAKPKHNCLEYGRVPNKNIIIFDIWLNNVGFMPYEKKECLARDLGLEVVPLVAQKKIESSEEINQLMERESILGGKIEGLVFKNYSKCDMLGNTLMGKFVSESFKEKNKTDWKKDNPKQGDILINIATEYRSEARWEKAVQRFKEQGQLLNDPKDIGLLIRSVPQDILEEDGDDIKEKLFKWAWPHIARLVTSGLAEWYKEKIKVIVFDGKE